MTDSTEYKIDWLKMYFGDPYPITDKITVQQPTLGDIIEYGEKEFYSMLNNFIGNPTSFRLTLWDMGIDWNKISDFELFCSLVRTVPQSASAILFGDQDWSKFEYLAQNYLDDNGELQQRPVFYSEEQDILIDEALYNHQVYYLRSMFNIFPKVEKAKGKTTKEWIIQEEKEKREKEIKDTPATSWMYSLISACCNHPGFKYKKTELKEVGIVEFMDSVQRLQIYESSTALMKGMYSGFVDGSKIKPEDYDFMRSIRKDK